MKVRLTSRAIADIDRIYLDIAKQFGLRQADAYQRGLMESISVIADHPFLAHERTIFRKSIRLPTYKSHIIAYLVDDLGVLVVRVLHAHQNLRRIL
jgi:toxin ParE1/3/4